MRQVVVSSGASNRREKALHAFHSSFVLNKVFWIVCQPLLHNPDDSLSPRKEAHLVGVAASASAIAAAPLVHIAEQQHLEYGTASRETAIDQQKVGSL